MLNSKPKGDDDLAVKHKDGRAGDRQNLKQSRQNDRKQHDGMANQSTTECKPASRTVDLGLCRGQRFTDERGKTAESALTKESSLASSSVRFTQP